MGWLPSRNRESETSPSGFMGQTDVNSSRKYSGREWKRNRLSRAVATRYYQREIGIGREEERDVITLSRYRVSPLRTIRTKRIISFSLFPPFTRGEQRSTVFQLFPTRRVIRFNALDKHVDRSGWYLAATSIRESARFVEKSDGTTRHYRPTTIICDGLKPRITTKRSQSGLDNPANSSGPTNESL